MIRIPVTAMGLQRQQLIILVVEGNRNPAATRATLPQEAQIEKTLVA
jgi:hypothetical protein